jgi:hypothetical protein
MTTELNQLNKLLVMDYWQAIENAETNQPAPGENMNTTWLF